MAYPPNHIHGALHPSLDCQVKADIVHHQLMEINDMREMLCKQFPVCDYQPTASGNAQAGRAAVSGTR